MGDKVFAAGKGAGFCGRAGVAKKKATANRKSVVITVQMFIRMFDGNMGLAAIPKQYNRTIHALEYLRASHSSDCPGKNSGANRRDVEII
jgi:hypothetical protein